MAPRVLTISDIRVTNFAAAIQNPQQMPCCSFELGMARVSTTTVRCELLTLQDTVVRAREAGQSIERVTLTCSAMSDGPSIDTVFGKHSSLYIAFDPQVQGSAHLRVHLYSGNVPRPGNITGLGSVSLVAAVQAGAVSVHLLDRFGQVRLEPFFPLFASGPNAVVLTCNIRVQDAGDVEFVVHSDAPAEAPQSAANHLQAADSNAANALPTAEKGQAQPMDDTLPITPPQVQTNRLVPSSRSSTAGSDNGDIPVTFTGNRLGHVTSQDSYERGTFNNGVATPAFQDSYGNSRQVSESTSREDPWVSCISTSELFCNTGTMLSRALIPTCCLACVPVLNL